MNDDEVMRKYGSIINLPHHVSRNRRPMSHYQRGAQFAPFAALSEHAGGDVLD